MRDPIEKFISGYSEVIFRSYDEEFLKSRNYPIPRKHNNETYQQNHNSTKDMIISLFNFDYSKIVLNELSHIFPISRAFFSFKISIVGIVGLLLLLLLIIVIMYIVVINN